MREIKTYFKGAPFYNAFLWTWVSNRECGLRLAPFRAKSNELNNQGNSGFSVSPMSSRQTGEMG